MELGFSSTVQIRQETIMRALLEIVGIWFSVNLAIFAFILWQRSPHFRHRIFRLTLGAFSWPSDRRLAHALVETAKAHLGRYRHRSAA
jgi:hypothetical protein